MTNQTTTAELPNWEALYEPGNVSTYLIGYANDQDAATGMAEAWMRSQAEVTGRLEWVDDERLATGRYDRWFELIECHGDGVDTGTGIVVRRRVADEPAPAAVSAAVAPPTNHGLSVQHADALYDAIATPGPARESFDDQHARVCAVVRQILDDLLPTPAEPTDRAAVLHEVADELTRKANKLTERVHDLAYFVAKDRLREAEILDREATELRRMADETATETPAAEELERGRAQLLEAMSAVSEDRTCCGWASDWARTLHAEGGIWETLGRAVGWPTGNYDQWVWVSWDEATTLYAAGARQDGAET